MNELEFKVNEYIMLNFRWRKCTKIRDTHDRLFLSKAN